jgi:hypothetical protein
MGSGNAARLASRSVARRSARLADPRPAAPRRARSTRRRRSMTPKNRTRAGCASETFRSELAVHAADVAMRTGATAIWKSRRSTLLSRRQDS